MPIFSFKGFLTGSSVALSAMQGPNSSFGSVPTWGQQQSMGSVEIDVIAPTAVTAPVVIGFEAINLTGLQLETPTPPAGTNYDPEFHEITYFWKVTGRDMVPYLAPVNMVNGWNNPNLAYGKKIAFHFPDTGTFTVELWAVDRNGDMTDVASSEIIVLSPDSAFPGTQTVCYSNDPGETWANEKSGCQRITSWGGLQNAINSANAPLRVLFKRGQEYLRTETGLLRFTNAGAYLNFVGTWGSGQKPILHGQDTSPLFETFNANHATDFLTFDNIDFRGDWDATTETGVASYSPFQFWSNDRDTHFTVSRCDFSGFSLIMGTPGETESFIGYADCVVTNWQDMGLFYLDGPSAFVAKIGCRIQQHERALNGPPSGEGKNGFYNQHGCMRYGNIGHFYVASCDMFSRNGWFDRTDQPCMRMVTNGLENSFIIDRVVCEGGSDQITMSGNNGGSAEEDGNYLIDRALLIGTAMTFRSFIYAEYGGLTVRNVLGVLPDVAQFRPDTWQASVRLTGQLDGANESAPVQIYGNTFLNLQTPANDPGNIWDEVEDDQGFTNLTVENNIRHAPLLNTPVTADGTVELINLTGIEPRYKGILFNEFGQEAGTLSSAVPNNGSIVVPYPSGTNQAYWQGLPGTDNKHQIRMAGTNFLHASRAQILVSFESSGVRITNTSGSQWASGSDWILKLDRKSQMSNIPTTYESPSSLPLLQLADAIYSGGLLPYDDFNANRRITPSSGALNPS